MDPNDTDAAFAADAALGVKTEQRARRSTHTGEYDALAARGGIDMEIAESSHEETPLLESSSGGQGRKGSTWQVEKEFEGLPWYRTPSVRFHSRHERL